MIPYQFHLLKTLSSEKYFQKSSKQGEGDLGVILALNHP